MKGMAATLCVLMGNGKEKWKLSQPPESAVLGNRGQPIDRFGRRKEIEAAV
jgi:hypothetical protein